MAFKDYSDNPTLVTTIGESTFIGPNMARNDVRPALQQLAADGRDLYDEMIARNGGSDLPSFISAGAGAVARTAQSKMRDVVSVKDFGATGLGVADDYAAIVLARAEAIATGKALHFPDGVYAYGTRLELGFPNLKVTFGSVTLKPTYAGVGVSFDSGPFDPLNPPAVFGVHFGWSNPPTIQGNVNTTDAVYVRGSHHMKLDVRIRDCTTGMNVEFSVGSTFIERITGNEGPFLVRRPTTGLIVNGRGAPEATTTSSFQVVVEGMSGIGVDLVLAQGCTFTGTSEGNDAGGIRVRSNSVRNIFTGVFCEQNGAAPHWNIEGSDNILIGCTGGGITNTGTNTNTIPGVRNKFIRGAFQAVNATGFYNDFDQTTLSGTLVKGNNIFQFCKDHTGAAIADTYPLPTITAPALMGAWVQQTANSERAVGYYKDRSGIVHLTGAVKSGTGVIFTLPVGFRPGGILYQVYDNVTAGSVGRVAVGTNGQVQHLTGDTTTVSLDNITFLAEG